MRGDFTEKDLEIICEMISVEISDALHKQCIGKKRKSLIVILRDLGSRFEQNKDLSVKARTALGSRKKSVFESLKKQIISRLQLTDEVIRKLSSKRVTESDIALYINEFQKAVLLL